MNINKNGINVINEKPKELKRRQLEYTLDEITFYRKEHGEMITIVVPKISHLRKVLKSDGWKILKEN